MEFNTDNRCITYSMRFNLAPRLVILSVRCATSDVGAKSPLRETALLEPASKTAKEVAPWYMEPAFTVHTVSSAVEDISSTIVESDSDTTEQSLQPALKSVLNPSFDTRNEIARMWANLGVMTRPDIEGIVKARLTKLTNTLQGQILNNMSLLPSMYYNRVV